MIVPSENAIIITIQCNDISFMTNKSMAKKYLNEVDAINNLNNNINLKISKGGLYVKNLAFW